MNKNNWVGLGIFFGIGHLVWAAMDPKVKDPLLSSVIPNNASSPVVSSSKVGLPELPSMNASPSVNKLANLSLIDLRDPFKKPVLKIGHDEHKISILEQYALDQWKLVGISTGPLKLGALFRGPDGATYVGNLHDHIGLRDGKIVEINSKNIVVLEKSTNVIGQEEESRIAIPLIVVGNHKDLSQKK